MNASISTTMTWVCLAASDVARDKGARRGREPDTYNVALLLVLPCLESLFSSTQVNLRSVRKTATHMGVSVLHLTTFHWFYLDHYPMFLHWQGIMLWYWTIQTYNALVHTSFSTMIPHKKKRASTSARFVWLVHLTRIQVYCLWRSQSGPALLLAFFLWSHEVATKQTCMDCCSGCLDCLSVCLHDFNAEAHLQLQPACHSIHLQWNKMKRLLVAAWPEGDF